MPDRMATLSRFEFTLSLVRALWSLMAPIRSPREQLGGSGLTVLRHARLLPIRFGPGLKRSVLGQVTAAARAGGGGEKKDEKENERGQDYEPKY
jgi:hypothetical protein